MWRGRQYCNPNCKVTLTRKTQNNVAVDRVTDPSSMSSSSWPLIQLQFTANCCCLFQWRHDISNYVGCCCYSYFYMRACIGLITRIYQLHRWAAHRSLMDDAAHTYDNSSNYQPCCIRPECTSVELDLTLLHFFNNTKIIGVFKQTQN